MVSDALTNLYAERDKRKEILVRKPDAQWAKDELKDIEKQIKKLEDEEKGD